MERDDVAGGADEFGNIFLIGTRVRGRPHRRGEGLGGIHFAGPAVNGLQEGEGFESFGVLRLIVQAPGEDARIFPVLFQDLFNVAFHQGPLLRIVDDVFSGRCHPDGIVHARNGLRLRTRVGILDGTSIGKNGHQDAQAVLVGQADGLFQPVHKSLGIFLPDNVAEEEPDGIEAQILGQGQFGIDHIRAEKLLAPDFDGRSAIRRHVYTAYRPRLGIVPLPGLFFTPFFCGADAAADGGQHTG